jgi:hypothetical protein
MLGRHMGATMDTPKTKQPAERTERPVIVEGRADCLVLRDSVGREHLAILRELHAPAEAISVAEHVAAELVKR